MNKKEMTAFLVETIGLLVTNKDMSEGDYLNFVTDKIVEVVEKTSNYATDKIKGVNNE